MRWQIIPIRSQCLISCRGYEKKWTEYVDINKVSSQQLITLSGGRADTEFGGLNHYFTIGYLPELSEYADVVKSQTDTATFECSISEKTMDHYGLVAGEKIYLHVPMAVGKGNFFRHITDLP